MNVYAVKNAVGQTLSHWQINKMLKNLGVSEKAMDEGTLSAIEQDATKQSIDLNQIAELAIRRGKPVNDFSDKSKESRDAELVNLGVPTRIILQGPEAVRAYAVQNGIKIPQNSSGQLNLVA